MDALVAARVPVEVKERGNRLLSKMGATPTQLINAAYRHLLAFGTLPLEERELGFAATEGTKLLTSEQRARLEAQMRALRVSAYDYTQGGTKTFKQALTEKRKAEQAKLREVEHAASA